ncbi:MAG: hypothetical protein K6F94_05950 [Bacteroidaceae bacterium]|nr:hypothetical protein [Bacteroidaceae bacterium]
MGKYLFSLSFLLLNFSSAVAGIGVQEEHALPPIDRHTVVSRNNPVIRKPDPLSALSVGNGHFVTTVDVTGLQSFPEAYRQGVPLTAMSDWGWHRFSNTAALREEETQRTFTFPCRQHSEVYAVEYKHGGRQQQATEYFRVNPHRLNLGTIGLQMQNADGVPLSLQQISNIEQVQKMYDGVIESHFTVGGEQVDVQTSCVQDRDAIIYSIRSQLLRSGRAAVSIRFSYPTGKHADDANDWSHPERHQSVLIFSDARSAVIKRTLDDTNYYLTLRWEGEASIRETAAHTFVLTTKSPLLNFEAEYNAAPTENTAAFSFRKQLSASKQAWHSFWQSGGIVDFSLCADPRAKELERRVLQSLYLTKINCANSTPPQETGLTYNSWFGRPHLEMTWWHAIHFSLWGRPEILETMLKWYSDIAYPVSKRIAWRQGFKGIRWMKMTDPWAGEAPSNTGSFLIWQQPHYIYMAEEIYRHAPSAQTLSTYARLVEETALFMADFIISSSAVGGHAGIPAEGKKKSYCLVSATSMQESMSKDFSYNHPFELAYWHFGLSVAQLWRERQGLPRHPEWDDILKNLSPLPEKNGIYTAGLPLTAFSDSSAQNEFDPFLTPAQQGQEKISEEAFLLKSRSDHPAVLGVCALLPPALYDAETMRHTLDWVMENWNWPTTWGWDYAMIAMAAARLGQPETALRILLSDYQKNTYLPSGHNFQTSERLRVYLPGNGALLTAIAMMCAGWDGGPSTPNPGFPNDGRWNVRWENLQRMQ